MILSTKKINDKVKVGLRIIFYAFLLIGLGILFSSCGTLTQEERDNLDREYKRFQQPPEPYVPSPRDFRRE